MKVFFYEEENELETVFLRPQYEIPFLGITLFDFSKQAFERLAEQINETVEFFVPNNWDLNEKKFFDLDLTSKLSDEPELVFFTNVYSLFFADLDKEYIQHLKQNKGKAFSRDGTVCTFMSSKDVLKEPKDDSSLESFFYVEKQNFLHVNQKLVSRLHPVPFEGNAKIFGSPVIFSQEISNSTICGPSFIGPDVKIYNSYIAPGTILVGETTIAQSKVFSSFINQSHVSNSEIESVLSSDSQVVGLTMKDSLIPYGGLLLNER